MVRSKDAHVERTTRRLFGEGQVAYRKVAQGSEQKKKKINKNLIPILPYICPVYYFQGPVSPTPGQDKIYVYFVEDNSLLLSMVGERIHSSHDGDI